MINGLRTIAAKSSRSSAALRSLSTAAARATSSHRIVAGATNPASVTVQSQEQNFQPQYRWFSDETKKEEAAAAETATEEPPKEEEPAAAAAAAEESPEQKLQAEVKELKDQLLRSLAEQENTRNIARKDVDSARNFAIKSFAKSLLEVSDNLNRALESVDESELETNTHLSSLYQGIQMTNDGLIKAFQSNGVTKFCEEPGDGFDPETMNALMEYPDESREPGTVGQVIKSGFMLNNRVLRPAEVGVVKKP
ncbi:unnamed protein product [Cylindrotheca closterium]|uniref:GrpE protein homolog n=1 Tax=Cylindrotheca closterium TaxID=2856 RepID=A0AAD2G672_9STRA|nr:unnamed protein product [Cylindrotheca closterium]